MFKFKLLKLFLMRKLDVTSRQVLGAIKVEGELGVYWNLRIEDPLRGYRDTIIPEGDKVELEDGRYRITQQGLEKL